MEDPSSQSPRPWHLLLSSSTHSVLPEEDLVVGVPEFQETEKERIATSFPYFAREAVPMFLPRCCASRASVVGTLVSSFSLLAFSSLSSPGGCAAYVFPTTLGLIQTSGAATTTNINKNNRRPQSLTTTMSASSAASSSAESATSSSQGGSSSSSHLYVPSDRDSYYGPDIARYLVDLHDTKSTFNFCGGMLFQLALSDKLRSHLVDVSSSKESPKQPVLHGSSKTRMSQLDNYSQSASADDFSIFHGREIRQVPTAAGGMGFVLQMSYSQDDPEGWTSAEVDGYDGWGHDSGRVWRKGDRLVREGFTDFQTKFGPHAFALHHRFYLHKDSQNRMWLSAEDGCEGTPAPSSNGGPRAILSNLFGAGQ